jgi:3-phenylpropionate/trans-cinnamate dioxygenase ferredoxin reductase component
MQIVILGNGIAGITAARYLRKLDSAVQITVISAETDYFFSRTALMYVYMGDMRFEDTMPYEKNFWAKNRITLVNDYIANIDTDAQTLTGKQANYRYDALLLATGSTPAFHGWQGQNLAGVQGLYSYQDLLTLEKNTKNIQQATIIGGGLIGIELAEMLHSRNIAVQMVVRETAYWSAILPQAESEMIGRHLHKHHIKVLYNTNLMSIAGDDKGRVKAVTLSNGYSYNTQLVGITAGVRPNVDFLRQQTPQNIDLGHGILVDDYLRTNVANVYAAGDCAQLRTHQPHRRAVEAVWYTGRMMGETAAYNMLGKAVPYAPRLWFNSAKFFDIEYQTYGFVPPVLPDNLASLYWEHSGGERSVRINYDKASQAVVGFNLMGIRYRHEVCEKWILDATPLETVLQNLGLANFDPEFFKEYEADILAIYTQQTGKKIVLKQRRGLDAVRQFLNIK